MTEISYIFPDIFEISGYLDLFSDISGVQPLRCPTWFSSVGWAGWGFICVYVIENPTRNYVTAILASIRNFYRIIHLFIKVLFWHYFALIAGFVTQHTAAMKHFLEPFNHSLLWAGARPMSLYIELSLTLMKVLFDDACCLQSIKGFLI